MSIKIHLSTINSLFSDLTSKSAVNHIMKWKWNSSSLPTSERRACCDIILGNDMCVFSAFKNSVQHHSFCNVNDSKWRLNKLSRKSAKLYFDANVILVLVTGLRHSAEFYRSFTRSVLLTLPRVFGGSHTLKTLVKNQSISKVKINQCFIFDIFQISAWHN